MSSQKISLEPTAAFVMSLGKDLFQQSEIGRSFYESLDLSSGDELIAAHHKAGIHRVTSELMCNRKYIVRELVAKEAAAAPVQVVLLAAGKSPLGLEVLDRHEAGVIGLYEVDVASFSDKKKIYERLRPGLMSKVHFIEQDIGSPFLKEQLAAHRFDPSRRTVLVLEGITHYIDESRVLEIFEAFRSPGNVNPVIVEYGQTFDSLDAEVLQRAKVAYRIVEERHFAAGMFKYSKSQLSRLMAAVGGALTEHFTLDRVEKLRTGRNTFFPTPGSGWIEVVSGRI